MFTMLSFSFGAAPLSKGQSNSGHEPPGVMPSSVAAVDLHHRYSFCDDDVDDDDGDDDDDERFYIALFSTIEQIHCSFFACDFI